ncbi:DUF3040 domain-containing protein [Pseudonocardia sp. HH130630-07]|uniref:DUF3040 domain-containing protein n=1 Tax=Pseudonocardia sp. HH130630-07 TaxID=1690815 RepID=UPI0008150F07|nr:DUF3040 domain-containing protein [Pseudonocardia sp. HH130630-07]ANY08531.1 hypothetical protein AFB00_22190 [Pseudonocardia sp. HH130630-07]
MSATLPPPPSSQPADGVPDPDPRSGARPLDRAEERALSGLEGELRRSDPGLDSEMAVLEDSARSAAPGGSADRVLQAVAVAVIVLVLVPTDWLAGFLSFGLLLGVPAAMALIAARARREGIARRDGATGEEPRDR